MMDRESVRKQLEETRQRIAEIDEEKEILESLVRGFEGWLRLHAPIPAHAVMSSEVSDTYFGNEPKGAVSMGAAIKEAIKESGHVVMHTKEIYEAALAKGAVTESKNPLNIVDIHLGRLAEQGLVQKLGGRRWQLATKLPTPGHQASWETGSGETEEGR